MNEFIEVAERIASRVDSMAGEGNFSADMIPGIANEAAEGAGGWGKINCYPGIPGENCHELALFISLKSKFIKGPKSKKLKHLSCREALEKIVQHTQGHCPGHTQRALLVTDNWDIKAFDDWHSTLLQIKNQVHLEIYLMISGKVSPIPI